MNSPLAGCAAWLVCKLIPEPHNQQSYDLFIAEVVAAWAFEDRMVRRRYLATPATGGSWSVQALEIVEQRPAPSL
mgnify:CR=1 FL=1